MGCWPDHPLREMPKMVPLYRRRGNHTMLKTIGALFLIFFALSMTLNIFFLAYYELMDEGDLGYPNAI